MTPIPSLPGLLTLALLTGALSAQAEPRRPGSRPDPLDPQAPVPALTYVSSLKAEPRATSDKPLSWREANDTAARIGGWRTYLREAQQPGPAAAPASAASSSAAAQGAADRSRP